MTVRKPRVYNTGGVRCESRRLFDAATMKQIGNHRQERALFVRGEGRGQRRLRLARAGVGLHGADVLVRAALSVGGKGDGLGCCFSGSNG